MVQIFSAPYSVPGVVELAYNLIWEIYEDFFSNSIIFCCSNAFTLPKSFPRRSAEIAEEQGLIDHADSTLTV